MAIEKVRTRWTAAALTVALALVLATTVLAAPALALPANFWGAGPQSALTVEQYERLDRGGVESVRVGFDWGSMQPHENGPIDWSATDSTVERAALAGVDVLPAISGAPRWAVPTVKVPGGHGASAPAHLPASGAAASAWKQLLRKAAQRYGSGGEFWSSHPKLPERPVSFWQIWNEPNFRYFVAKPNPIEYGRLIKLSYAALHGADRGARLVLAGLFSQPKGSRHLEKKGAKTKLVNRGSRDYFASYFLEQLYKHTPGVKSKIAAVALHPYASNWRQLTGLVEEVRGVLAKSHDAGKGLWLTELGWSSGYGNAFSKGVAGQARELKGAFSLLLKMRAKWRVQRVYWFSVDDVEGVCNFCDGSGLFGNGFKPKKAWYEYVKFTGGVAG